MKPVPVYLRKFNNVVETKVVKKRLYNELIKKVNVTDANELVKKHNKHKKHYNAETNEIKGEICCIVGLATTTALNAVDNLVKKNIILWW